MSLWLQLKSLGSSRKGSNPKSRVDNKSSRLHSENNLSKPPHPPLVQLAPEAAAPRESPPPTIPMSRRTACLSRFAEVKAWTQMQYYRLLLAERHLTRTLFGGILRWADGAVGASRVKCDRSLLRNSATYVFRENLRRAKIFRVWGTEPNIHRRYAACQIGKLNSMANADAMAKPISKGPPCCFGTSKTV